MWTSMESPLGPLKIVAHRGAVTAVEFTGPVAGAATAGPRSSMRFAAERATGRPVGDRADDDPLLVDTVAQLAGYFAREVKEFDLPLRPDGTAFQLRVWEQLGRVPYGETASYGELARRLGMNAGASRAVGAANGRNPVAIIIPCHRVVGSSGLLTGYAGGVERKQALLDLEQHALF